MSEIVIRSLSEEDCPVIAAAFAAQGWSKPESQYRRYLDEAQQEKRVVFVAEYEGAFAGYVTLVWESDYAPFRERGIPEIVDLNVLKSFQRRGIASALMDAAEQKARERSLVAGLGVGLTADYGNAQRMYVKRGYVFDGKGISQRGKFLGCGDTAVVDDDLVLCLTKQLNPVYPSEKQSAVVSKDPGFQKELKSMQDMLENL